jgi:alpha-mannosidase
MNNYCHTNYMADQEGLASLHFGLYPHGLFNAVEAYRRGIEHNQPLLVRRVDPSESVTPSLLALSTSGVAVTSVKRTEDGKGMIVRLFGASGRPEEFTMSWRTPMKVFESSLFENRGARVKGPLRLPAFGIVTLRCEPE